MWGDEFLAAFFFAAWQIGCVKLLIFSRSKVHVNLLAPFFWTTASERVCFIDTWPHDRLGIRVSLPNGEQSPLPHLTVEFTKCKYYRVWTLDVVTLLRWGFLDRRLIEFLSDCRDFWLERNRGRISHGVKFVSRKNNWIFYGILKSACKNDC